MKVRPAPNTSINAHHFRDTTEPCETQPSNITVLICFLADQSPQSGHLDSASAGVGRPARAAQSRPGNPPLRTSPGIVRGSLGMIECGSDIWKQPKSPQCGQTVRIHISLPYRRWMLTRTRERMFAKPFLGQLGSGHVQGVYSMCKVGFLQDTQGPESA